MDLLIFLGLGVFALALVFAVFFKKIVIDRQIEKLNDLEDEVEKAKLKAKEIDEIIFKELTKISIYTYYKNYEFLISPKQSDDIITLIQCLRRYKQLK